MNNLDENNLDKASAPTVRAAEHESVKWPTIRNGADASSGEAKFRREKQTIGEEARRNQQRDEQQPNERKSQQMRRMKKKNENRKPASLIHQQQPTEEAGSSGDFYRRSAAADSADRSLSSATQGWRRSAAVPRFRRTRREREASER